MRITVLVDNAANPARPELGAEHGLSLVLQAKGVEVLFDAGASPRFLDNARLLDMDLATVQAAVLSHGHYDHGGGFAAFAAANATARIFVGPGAFEEHFLGVAGPLKKRIGVPVQVRKALDRRVEVVTARTEIAKEVFLLPCGRSRGGEPPGSRAAMLSTAGATETTGTVRFLRKTPAGLRPDDFTHELMLVAVDRGEMVVFTGCSHSGIMEMIAAARAAFPGLPVRAVIGGLHLTNPATRKLAGTHESVAAIGRALADDPSVRQVFSGHCTGDAAFALLKQEMGGKLEKLETGMRIEP